MSMPILLANGLLTTFDKLRWDIIIYIYLNGFKVYFIFSCYEISETDFYIRRLIEDETDLKVQIGIFDERFAKDEETLLELIQTPTNHSSSHYRLFNAIFMKVWSFYFNYSA